MACNRNDKITIVYCCGVYVEGFLELWGQFHGIAGACERIIPDVRVETSHDGLECVRFCGEECGESGGRNVVCLFGGLFEGMLEDQGVESGDPGVDVFYGVVHVVWMLYGIYAGLFRPMLK
jgi:hypothetical protein